MSISAQVETLALVAVARLGDDAYGVTIHDDIERIAGRAVSMAGVYSALDRLDARGLVRTFLSEPRPERGGRSRRHYALTALGRNHLERERALAARIWDGLSLDAPGKRR
jgi:PadR family transcriptional regulator, regulatory protein PadR